jgi:hypothetical protein
MKSFGFACAVILLLPSCAAIAGGQHMAARGLRHKLYGLLHRKRACDIRGMQGRLGSSTGSRRPRSRVPTTGLAGAR